MKDLQKLIIACKKKDRKAQKELYDLYVKLLMFVALRYVNDTHTAKDIVQETMIRFFRSVDRLDFPNKKALDAYFRRMTVNESIRWIQKNNKIELLELIDHTRNLECNQGESILFKNSLLEDIKNLKNGYRVVFNLYAIEGYSHKEIAEKLNITESTSRSQLSRARSILQKKISNRLNYVKGI